MRARARPGIRSPSAAATCPGRCGCTTRRPSPTRAGATRPSSSGGTGARRCWRPDCPTRRARSRPSCWPATDRAGAPGRAGALPGPGELARGRRGRRPAAARSARDSFRRQGREVATARRSWSCSRPGVGRSPRSCAGRRRGAAGRGGSRRRARRTHRSHGCWRAGPRPTPARDDAAELFAAAARVSPPSVRARPSHRVARRGTRPGPARRDARRVARLPPRAGRARRPSGHAGEHRAAGAGLGARGRAGPAGAWPRGRTPARVRSCGGASVAGDGAGPARAATADDDELAGLLAALRANDRRLAEARDDDERRACWSASGPGSRRRSSTGRRLVGVRGRQRPVRAGLDVGPSGRRGRRRDVRGAGRGRRSAAVGRRHRRPGAGVRVGSAADAAAAVDAARFVLRQAARGRPVRLADIGLRLQQALLGPSVAAFGDRERSSSRRPPRCTRRRGGCCPPWPACP